MNNEQFRRLVGTSTPNASASDAVASTPSRTVALGSKQKSSIQMTPRSLGFSKNDFQRQLADRNEGEKRQKNFRSSVPKGSKLAQGYRDRAREREAAEEDERAVRIKALEESLKKDEVDQATYDKLVSQIAGGDLSSTHLIKGLDFKLLERIRKGENVYGESKEQEAGSEPEDVEDAFAQLEETQVEAIAREKAVKKGQLAAPALKPGRKRTRDMILAEMKAARAAAKAKEQSALGNKFKKIGGNVPGSSRIEQDSKGREVLIVVDENGNEKRKIRKLLKENNTEADADAERQRERELMMPDKDAKPLGMEVPEFYKPKPDEPQDDDMDIFDGVGDEYDPLAGLDEESGDEDNEEAEKESKTAIEEKDSKDTKAMPPPPLPASTSEPRSYFKDSKLKLVSDETFKAPSWSDPAIQAAFKKAASLKYIPRLSDEDDEKAKAKSERHRKMLQNNDRDAEDMDMGFGTSRFEDEADLEESDIKLSQWGDEADNDEQEGGKSKRKRGGKKRKGDVNNAADIMRVIEQRNSAQ